MSSALQGLKQNRTVISKEPQADCPFILPPWFFSNTQQTQIAISPLCLQIAAYHSIFLSHNQIPTLYPLIEPQSLKSALCLYMTHQAGSAEW